ncbi:MAG TPA: DNA repair protein RadC [Syntrophomonas sp.]|jgi:DNA repair protein RadC|nr:DNA repair protein RadC [Syntrophomonas sp.]
MDYQFGIKDMPPEMRPRERLSRHGETHLSEGELLAIILGNGTRNISALELANRLLVSFKGLRNIREAQLEELTQVKGIGPAKAVTIKAAIELGRRTALDVKIKDYIHSPADVSRLLMEEMRYYDREYLYGLYLDRKGGLLTKEVISIGSLSSSIVHPREVFKAALKVSASSIIVAHNHPSGDPTPSQEDLEITRRLAEAGKIMGIELMDHLVIGHKSFCSLKEKGVI